VGVVRLDIHLEHGGRARGDAEAVVDELLHVAGEVEEDLAAVRRVPRGRDGQVGERGGKRLIAILRRRGLRLRQVRLDEVPRLLRLGGVLGVRPVVSSALSGDNTHILCWWSLLWVLWMVVRK
jgi:hypothetical protein